MLAYHFLAPRHRHEGWRVDQARKLVSIVMLTFNRLALTRRAIASLRASTRQPYELIVVDNGSTDETPAFLADLEAEGARVVRNPINRGVAAGWNQGLRLANGDCLMVLNNDVVLTGDWLERMTRAAYEVPRAGLVSCRTNVAGGPQALLTGDEDPAGLPFFAHRHAALADRSWFELPRLVAVALLWRRETFDRLGEFDERFTPASYEDDDYSLRSLQAGYRNIVANDVFIDHVGSASHLPNGIDFAEIRLANRRRFIEKWGDAAPPLLTAGWAAFEEHVALLRPDQHALPAGVRPDWSRGARARSMARLARRCARIGWHLQARETLRRSLRERVTLQGIAGLLGTLRPVQGLSSGSEPRTSGEAPPVRLEPRRRAAR